MLHGMADAAAPLRKRTGSALSPKVMLASKGREVEQKRGHPFATVRPDHRRVCQNHGALVDVKMAAFSKSKAANK